MTPKQTEALTTLLAGPATIPAATAGALKRMGYVDTATPPTKTPFGYSFVALTDAGRQVAATA